MFACLYAPGCSARLMEVIPQSRGPLADARGSEGPETSRDSVLSRDRQGAAGLSRPETEGLLLECAYQFTPLVEETGGDTVVLDLSGLGRLYGTPRKLAAAVARRAAELGFEVNVAMASNPDAAIHAARGFAGVTIMAQGEEGARLGDLPLEVLTPPLEMLETFDRWGIHTFRDLAALPEVGIAERLGQEGVRLQKLARGTFTRPLRPAIAELRFEAGMELEHPVESLEPLAFVLARLLNDLCRQLEIRALATAELRLQLTLEDRKEYTRTLRLPVPMRDPKVLLKLWQLDLEAHPPAAAILGVVIAAEPAKPRALQTGLFVPLAPEPEKLEVTLARIAKLVGEGNAGSATLVDTHRPGAFRMNRFEATVNGDGGARKLVLPLRVFRPPRPAKVRTGGKMPVHITAQGIQGRVVSAAGPWRTCGDWWRQDAWARDEWDVALSDGALYRLYCESGQWFIEGRYD